MNKRIELLKLGGRKQLWTREKAWEIRNELDKTLSSLDHPMPYLNIEGIEVFDYSLPTNSSERRSYLFQVNTRTASL